MIPKKSSPIDGEHCPALWDAWAFHGMLWYSPKDLIIQGLCLVGRFATRFFPRFFKILTRFVMIHTASLTGFLGYYELICKSHDWYWKSNIQIHLRKSGKAEINIDMAVDQYKRCVDIPLFIDPSDPDVLTSVKTTETTTRERGVAPRRVMKLFSTPSKQLPIVFESIRTRGNFK